MSSARPVIVADSVRKTVPTSEGDLTLLDNISLSIQAGESVAIVGASGSGKTTLLGLLAGLDTASQGRIQLNGIALDTLDEDGRAALRQQWVGFVFQSFLLVPHFTAIENVMLALEVTGRGNEDTAREWLKRVGLGHRFYHTPRQLSGGEQQRVALARAFAGHPAILFADEPTGNLDGRTGSQIADLLFSLNETAGTTLVLVTHDEKLAARCQRQIRLEDGAMVAE